MQRKFIKTQDPEGKGDLKRIKNLQKSQSLGKCDVILLLGKPAARHM